MNRAMLLFTLYTSVEWSGKIFTFFLEMSLLKVVVASFKTRKIVNTRKSVYR